ncbi:vegetative cell wall protein gp1-like [Panicum virgatum]|uniref:vegetative cell wall protein gp1-like n=1 Tax=Panicum virgatum TaxID=38727 RepID=UPI0019D633DA|nr:vegetative cell wall protein gp1-like [Panicum virgatum]
MRSPPLGPFPLPHRALAPPLPDPPAPLASQRSCARPAQLASPPPITDQLGPLVSPSMPQPSRSSTRIRIMPVSCVIRLSHALIAAAITAASTPSTIAQDPRHPTLNTPVAPPSPPHSAAAATNPNSPRCIAPPRRAQRAVVETPTRRLPVSANPRRSSAVLPGTFPGPPRST